MKHLLPPPMNAQQTPRPRRPRTLLGKKSRRRKIQLRAMNRRRRKLRIRRARPQVASARLRRRSLQEILPAALARTRSADNGDEELAMAQHFLNGTSSHGRDSAEAAKWLWKSIAKHNSAATVLLRRSLSERGWSLQELRSGARASRLGSTQRIPSSRRTAAKSSSFWLPVARERKPAALPTSSRLSRRTGFHENEPKHAV